MPTPLWAALAPVLVLALWLITRRRPRSLLRSTDTSAVAALNRAQLLERRLTDGPESQAPEAGSDAEAQGDEPADEPAMDGWVPPRTAAERLAARRQIRGWFNGDPEQRLRAVRMARLWPDASVLPLLKRALRDVNPEVMAAAAAAIAPFRGRSVQGLRQVLPRRVSRTR